MLVYHSPIGDWFIIPSSGRYQLVFSSVCYGVYHSAVAAADDVYCFATGCDEWDLLAGSLEPPQDPSEWDSD